jgi:hypothetical protein
LVSSLIILCSCNIKSRSTELSSDYRKCVHKMDSSVNEFNLMDSISLDTVFMLQVDNYIVNDSQYGEGIYVSNDTNNEFVFMKFNCGRIGQEIDAFVLTDSIPSEFSKYKIQSKVLRFTSTHGAYIGMSKTDFINKYFNDNTPQTGLESIYVQYDSINLLYNKYFFRKDTLKKIEIGYDW